MSKKLSFATCFAFIFLGSMGSALAQSNSFAPGPRLMEFGPVVAVDGDLTVSPDQVWRHSFDVSERAQAGERNRGLESAARFYNMMAAAGAPDENVNVAIVVHGGAINDLLSAGAYGAKAEGAANPNAPLVAALVDTGARIIVCGQSAAAQGIAKGELLPGVEMDISAMTAHARLQQDGYTLNPF